MNEQTEVAGKIPLSGTFSKEVNKVDKVSSSYSIPLSFQTSFPMNYRFFSSEIR